MTNNDPSEQPKPTEPEGTSPPEPAENPAVEGHGTEDAEPETDSATQPRQRRILIGSQRDPAAYRARRTRDWTPIVEPDRDTPAEDRGPGPPAHQPSIAEAAPVQQPPAVKSPKPAPQPESPHPPLQQPAPGQEAPREVGTVEPDVAAEPGPTRHFPPPNLRDKLPPDLEREFDEALGDEPLEELLAGDESLANRPVLEEESRHTGRVVAVYHDDVFVELGAREQGCVSVKQFDRPPEVGTQVEVIVQRFNPEDGLYDLTMPDATVEVDDWADIKEGMLVEARVTGHNAGGLECEVSRLRGFIPVSQIALYRVDDLAEFVDEKFTCLVTEANPRRRNLVLSRRAVLEREKEEARAKLLASLQPGQIHEGVVRKLVDFGAFVDIGGLEGLLHISQLGWGRVERPSEVLAEGQTIRVKIEKIDHATGKMSLAYRELLENPWDGAEKKYPANTLVEGTVTNLMDFGAFVELEPGVEGLVHVSELAPKRVWRVSDVVQKGDKVEILVLSVDPQARRMSLSIRQATPEPEPKKEEPQQPGPLTAAASKSKPKRKTPDKPLQGGLGRASGGQQFGLKW